MISRRRFVQAGVAASAGTLLLAGDSLCSPPARANGTVRKPGLAYFAAIFDEQLPDGMAFGRAAERCGLDTRAIRGDITDLWYSQLHPQWQRRAVPIAGLTAYGALFCLERLAWDHGMRLVYHGSHRAASDGLIEHTLSGAIGATAPLTSTTASRAGWVGDVVQMIARIEPPSPGAPLPHARRSTEFRYTSRGTPPGAAADQTVFSWVIAPPRQA
jgi:hypothetical protein